MKNSWRIRWCNGVTLIDGMFSAKFVATKSACFLADSKRVADTKMGMHGFKGGLSLYRGLNSHPFHFLLTVGLAEMRLQQWMNTPSISSRLDDTLLFSPPADAELGWLFLLFSARRILWWNFGMDTHTLFVFFSMEGLPPRMFFDCFHRLMCFLGCHQISESSCSFVSTIPVSLLL